MEKEQFSFTPVLEDQTDMEEQMDDSRVELKVMKEK